MHFQGHGLCAAIFFTLLCMGGIGVLVVMPIAFIHWTWNSLIRSSGMVLLINPGQATLLYLAGVLLVYLSGLVRIEFDTEQAE